MTRVVIDQQRMEALSQLLIGTEIPPEQESSTHGFKWHHSQDALANCYAAIVAICHQTSPIGERRLEGDILGVTKYGWDYLKEKYLVTAQEHPKWSSLEFLAGLTPECLAELYRDDRAGRTLTRVNERCHLLNELSQRLLGTGNGGIRDAFLKCSETLAGDEGFLRFLSTIEAYRDPVNKKSLFFASLVAKECGWVFADIENLTSPVDYHELRGHLRIGTVVIQDEDLRGKVERGLPITESEDVDLRAAVQAVVNHLGVATGRGSSVLHYLFWNIFRNCCVRESSATHCFDCGSCCALPSQYKAMSGYNGKCVFNQICKSAGKDAKVGEPAYIGHFY